MSGQYSSAVAPDDSSPRCACANATSRPSALERIWGRSGWSLVTTVPSGRVIRTAGSFDFPGVGSTYAARKSKKLPHLRGFFAPATFFVAASTTAKLTIADEAALRDFGGVYLLPHHRLHWVAPQSDNRTTLDLRGRRVRRILLHDGPLRINA